MLCCLPVVTVGASLAAMHKVTQAMALDEDNGIVKTFFRGFRENFKQATALWLMMLFFAAAMGCNYLLISGFTVGTLATVLKGALVVAIGLVLVIACAFGANQFIYADKARYDAYPTVDNPYFQVNQYNTKGMIYSFLHQYNITKMTAPEGYNAKYFAEGFSKEQYDIPAWQKANPSVGAIKKWSYLRDRVFCRSKFHCDSRMQIPQGTVRRVGR